MHINFNDLIINYGYIIIFIGTFLEGESILILGSFLAQTGFLKLEFVILTAFCGSLSGDQFHFFIARFQGKKFLLKHPKWQEKIKKFEHYLNKYKIFIVIIFRFLYGLRTIASFSIGLSNITIRKFLLLNAIGALLWATTIGTLGYIFGALIQSVIHDVKKIEILVISVLVIIFIITFIYRTFLRSGKIKEKK